MLGRLQRSSPGVPKMSTPLAQDKLANAKLTSGPLARRTVILDNETTTVTFFHFKQGEETGWHEHTHDYVVVNLNDGTLRQFTIDGKETVHPATSRNVHAHSAGVEHCVR